MTNTALALTVYIGWTWFLMCALISYRSLLVLKKEKQANEFKSDGSDSPALGQRLTRAIGNSLESFPFVGGPMLLALAADLSSITEGLALIMIGARIGQALIHIASTSVMAVQIRFVFFVVQLAIAGWWLVQLLSEFI
jgi:hypothetical protein